MKKYLPFFLVGLGVLVLVIVFVLKSKKNQAPPSSSEDSEVSTEIKQADKPFTSLIPKNDGHWLKLTIDGIKVKADSLDYEILYKVSDGRTQGVPGTITLNGQNKIERDILLGSESSGKFRYDTGVETGTLTLRFRDAKGKLIGKLSTDFHLQTGVSVITSADGSFKFSLNKKEPKTFFVTMQTFATPKQSLVVVTNGDYSVFASDSLPHEGKILSQ